MDQIPIQVFLVPVIGLAAVAYMFWARKRTGQAHDQQFAGYRAGELAERLGLQLVAGDPNFNLFINYANVDVQRGPSDGKPVTSRSVWKARRRACRSSSFTCTASSARATLRRSPGAPGSTAT